MMDRDAVVGVTSNPTIFQKAISSGNAYDEQLRELLDTEGDLKEIFLTLSAEDVKAALALLRPTFDASGGEDGRVSWEVDPEIAYDRERTYQEAKRLHEWINEPNLYVKIPATAPGVGAIEDSIAAGRDINVTLIFSLERHKEVMEAYIRGLERFDADGGDVATVYSVASFFVSRVDTETDTRLEAIGRTDLAGKLAIANARLAYQNYKGVFSGARWDWLAAKRAHPQRCLWASTSTKNPAYRDVMYIEELIGPHTVNTMPEETIQAFQEHGRIADTLEQGLDEARKLFDDLREAGIDYDDVTDTLEREGVQKFTDSFEELKQGIAEKRDALARV
jgi:transaldolase